MRIHKKLKTYGFKDMKQQIAVSKYLSYLLRHHPENLKISDEGFVPIPDVLSKVQKKFPDVNKEYLEEMIERGNKRFQIKNNQIRALYGHSIPVTIQLDKNSEIDVLYHGTSEKSANNILKEGLKPKGRNKVHLSISKKEAIRVGKRHSKKPVILKINVKEARKNDIQFEKATENVVVSDLIPPEFISMDKN
jgi:putative RNA 2'-phosphotransferase